MTWFLMLYVVTDGGVRATELSGYPSREACEVEAKLLVASWVGENVRVRHKCIEKGGK